MIHTYFLGTEAFVILGYFLGSALFPKRYSLVFYKFFGITIFSLLVWYLSLITGIGWTNLIGTALVITVLISLFLLLLFRDRIRLPSRKDLMVFIGLEILSYVLYLFLVYIRTFKPDVIGTEKLMDVALINAIMKQNHIPIENPWLSGFYMNYYYFGHFILALFQFLFKIPTAVGYNLAISLIGVWIVQAGYLVAKVLNLKDLPAYFIGLLMTFGGNLYLVIQILLHNNANQWFASATRVIPFTINEFPSYSVILGDLHGHYLSYPFFLIGIFLLLDIFIPRVSTEKYSEWVIPKSAFLGILLGHLYLTNSWDVLTLALFGIIIVIGYTWYLRAKKAETWKNIMLWYKRVFLVIGLPVVLLSIPQFLSSRSYYLPPVGGIGFNTLYSGPGEIFMLFGQFFLMFIVAASVIVLTLRSLKPHIPSKFLQQIDFIVPMVMIFVGFLLIIIVEFFYAKDVFTTLNPPYSRTNTVFKIYFHVWAFLSLGGSVLVFNSLKAAFENIKKPRFFFVFYALFAGIVAVMFSYPVIAINQYIAPKFTPITIQRITDERWSNGYAFMKELHGADYDLVSYLLPKQSANILEIVTYDSYSYFGRIASYTGLSTVSGWPLHNVQWYNGYDGQGKRIDTHELVPMKVAERITDIETMYTSDDELVVQDLLDKYRVDYVVFGNQEFVWAAEKDKKLNIDVYNSLCRVDWQQDGATLFKCRN